MSELTPEHPDKPGAAAELSEDRLRRVTVGEPTLLNGPIILLDYDEEWPSQFAREAGRIRAALGPGALMLEHVGSTSVPGLIAKPVIDILLVVANSADEQSYLPALQAAGYVLRIREPEWHEHRLFKGPQININLHVFTAGSPESQRMLLLRDYLRNHPQERRLYADTKKRLASQSWKYVQDYADAKSQVIEAILGRARAASG